MTAKELAKELGVSAAAVSLAINGKPGISEKTRNYIIQKMEEMGCQQLLKKVPQSETVPKNIGFVIYKNDGKMLGLNSFYPTILDGVADTARRFGYTLVIINLERKEIQRQIQYITDAKCIGYVVFATEMQRDEIEIFKRLEIPFVLLDNYYNDQEINTVKVNNERNCYLAIKYLIDMGHRRIGYLSSGLNINSFLERRKYSKEILETFGIKNMDSFFFTLGYPIDQAEEKMRRILRQHAKEEFPTAFLADNDLVAIGAMQGMKEFGYRIPEDFSFIGNADRPISALVEPKLTTIRIPEDRFGAEAVFQLIQQLEYHRTSFTRVEINGELVIRESVRDLSKKMFD